MAGRCTAPDYLIDHSPDLSGAHGHRLVITSRSVDELQAIIQPVLAQHGIVADGRHAVAILDQLRSLSGRLAFKLISSATQRTEALGLALARLYLEHQGVFANQIVVPLDAHLDLYRTRRRQAEGTGRRGQPQTHRPGAL
jgi:DNA phosphorothioation-dependent restriction protein DptH